MKTKNKFRFSLFGSINKRASYVITSTEVNRDEINDQIINTDNIDN